MDQKVLIESLGKHLDALGVLVTWFVATALAMAFAGITRQKTIEVLGLKIRSRDAFYVAALLTLVAQVSMLLLFTRLLLVLRVLNNEHFLEGFTRLTTHEWFLNPFSFFGNTFLARLQSVVSYFLFFAILALCSLPLLVLRQEGTTFRTTTTFLLATISGGIAAAIWGVSWTALQRLHDLNPDLYAGVSSSFLEKTLCLMLIAPIVKKVRDVVQKSNRDID